MIDASVTGFDGLRAAIAKLPGVAQKRVSAAVDVTAEAILQDARASAPVRTGRLRAAIFSKILRRDGDRLRVRVGVSSPYALHVEFGTVRTPAQPFLGPAGDAQGSRFEQRIDAAGRDIESEMT